MTHAMIIQNTVEPTAASHKNQSSLPISAKSSTTTEKSRLATFLSMKSDQAAWTGLFQPRVERIFCARLTSQNEQAFPSTAVAPKTKGIHAPSFPPYWVYAPQATPAKIAMWTTLSAAMSSQAPNGDSAKVSRATSPSQQSMTAASWKSSAPITPDA